MPLSARFQRARFGLFFHLGHSSQQGVELSWPMVGGSPVRPRCQSLTVEQYQCSAATFDPKLFDAREWARLAKDAGAEYAVLTAKHHDGYATNAAECTLREGDEFYFSEITLASEGSSLRGTRVDQRSARSER